MGDYYEVYAYQTHGSAMTLQNTVNYTYFMGSLVTTNGGGGGGGGTATPAGSTNDVQFNSGGLLAADTGNFTYASSTLKTPSLLTGGITATGAASLTTVSSTLVQLISNTTTACTSSLAGSQRYNGVSNTIDYCSGSAWLSLGPSATQPISFLVTKGGTAQTVTANTVTKLTWSAKTYDTNNNFSTATSKYTPTIPGKYLVLLQAQCPDSASNFCDTYIKKNGVSVASGAALASNWASPFVSTIVDMNGTTDYLEAYVNNLAGTTVSGQTDVSYFGGALLSPQGGGSGGATTLSALSDVNLTSLANNDILQYDNATSKWVNVSASSLSASGDRITSGTLSIIANTGTAYASLTTNGTTWGYLSSAASYIPTLQTGFENNGTISTTLIQTGTNSATCNSGLYGGIRWNATSDTIQVCNSAGWISVASSTVPNTTISQGQDNYAAIFSGPNTLVTDSALYVDRTSHRVGIGTAAPSWGLDISSTGMRVSSINPLMIFNEADTGVSWTLVQDSGNIGFRYQSTSNTPLLQLSSGSVAIGSFSSGGSSLTIVNGEVQPGSSGAACVSASNGGAIRYTGGSLYYCNGANAWTSLGGGSGSPAGSTGDIQFNTGGAFDADTGKFYWDKTNHRLGIGTTSPAYTLDVSGTVRIKYPTSGQLLLDTAATSQHADVGFASNGSYKWTAGKNTDDSFYLWDAVASRNVIWAASNGNMALMPSGGNVGIGTYSPAAILDVSGTTGQNARFASSGGVSDVNYLTVGQRTMLGYDGTTGNAVLQGIGAKGIELNVNNGTFGSGTAVIINTAGNVGVGTMSPANTMDISGTLRTFDYVNSAGYVNPLSIAVGNNSGGTNYSRIALGQVTTNNMFIEAADQSNTKGTLMLQPYGGYVTVNSTASPTYALTVGGDVYLTAGWLRTTGATGWYNQTYGGGWYMTDSTYIRNYGSKEVLLNANITAPAFLYSSDKRLKSDITTLTGGLAKLDTLNPVSFRFTSDPSKTTHLGLIAQDVRKVYPEAVHADDKGFLKLDYPALIGPMIGMMKELKSIVFADHGDLVEAKAEIRQLKADNDNLEAANRTLKAANDNAMRRLDALERTQRAHGW